MIICNDYLKNPKYAKLSHVILSCQCSIKLHDILSEFAYDLLYKDGKSMNTVISYLYDIKVAIDFFIEYKNEDFHEDSLSKLTKLDFRSLCAQRREKDLSSFSQRRMISSWKSLFKFLKLTDIFTNSMRIKTPSTFPKPIELQVIEKLFQVDKSWLSYRNRALWGLLYGSGMRISEALNLNVYNYQNSENSLEITGKGGVIRKVPIFGVVRKWIDEYISICPVKLHEDGPLFIGAKFSRLLQQNASHILRKWKIKHGVDGKLSPHVLRHSFASHVLSQNCNLKVLQEVLGHKNLDTTSMYVKIEDKKLENSFTKIMNDD